MMSLAFLLLAACTASSTAFTGAHIDAPFFVFDGGSRGEGFGQFDHPSAIAEIGGGLLAIADTRNHRIKTVTMEGYFQDFWFGDFAMPGAIAAVGDGTVWIVDGANHRVQRLAAIKELVADITGTHVATIGGRGSAPGKFQNPTGIAVDSAGRVFVVDSGNRRIQQFGANGKFLKAWGDATRFSEPYGIVIDAADAIYVTDSARHRILKFDAKGKLLASWGEDQLDTPRGLAVRNGFLYVADSGNDRIVKFDVNGKYVGAVGCHGSGVGEFDDPVSVAIDPDLHLYVVDRANHRVQKLGHQ
jgi:DNA-binding beta-propeller fold protein YncE